MSTCLIAINCSKEAKVIKYLFSSTTISIYLPALQYLPIFQHYNIYLSSSTTISIYLPALQYLHIFQHYNISLSSSTTISIYLPALQYLPIFQHYNIYLSFSTTISISLPAPYFLQQSCARYRELNLQHWSSQIWWLILPGG